MTKAAANLDTDIDSIFISKKMNLLSDLNIPEYALNMKHKQFQLYVKLQTKHSPHESSVQR